MIGVHYAKDICIIGITCFKVPWKGVMYHNQALSKVVFIIWIQLLGRLYIEDRL